MPPPRGLSVLRASLDGALSKFETQTATGTDATQQGQLEAEAPPLPSALHDAQDRGDAQVVESTGVLIADLAGLIGIPDVHDSTRTLRASNQGSG